MYYSEWRICFLWSDSYEEYATFLAYLYLQVFFLSFRMKMSYGIEGLHKVGILCTTFPTSLFLELKPPD